MIDDNSNSKPRIAITIIISVIVLVYLTWAITSAYLIRSGVKIEEWANGFNALTSLVTALGLIGIAYNIHLANKHSKYIQEQINQQKIQIQQQNDSLKVSIELSRRQEAVNAIFKLTDLLLEIYSTHEIEGYKIDAFYADKSFIATGGDLIIQTIFDSAEGIRRNRELPPKSPKEVYTTFKSTDPELMKPIDRILFGITRQIETLQPQDQMLYFKDYLYNQLSTTYIQYLHAKSFTGEPQYVNVISKLLDEDQLVPTDDEAELYKLYLGKPDSLGQ